MQFTKTAQPAVEVRQLARTFPDGERPSGPGYLRCAFLLAFLALPLLPRLARAAFVPIGLLSFDNIIPGSPGIAGVNAFSIANFTGDPVAGGNALPPTFPVLTSVTFIDSSLTVTSDGSETTFDLGDIGPGFFSSGLEFADTQIFSSALFSATLEVTAFDLAGGNNAAPESSSLATFLVPATGDTLVAGSDFALIEISPVPSDVPEPRSLYVVAFVIAVFWRRPRGGRVT